MAKDLVKQIEKQIVFTNSLFAVDNKFEDERFMRVRIAVMHSGINRNKSRFSTDTIRDAKDTFANIPILADVQKFVDEDGNEYLDYTSHSMHLEDDAFNPDSQRMIYDEKVVGVVPETNDFEIIHDDETGNDYAYVSALLYRDYGNYVCDILESRGGFTEVSAEIMCDDCSFSAKDKCLDVGKMSMSGITLLGDAVTPGMAKAHAEVFSISEDSKQTQLITIMQELKESLDNYTATFAAKDTMKGGTQIKMNKFEELMQKYNKTIEDITFEYEGLSDEDLEAKFAELFEEPKKKVEDDDAPVIQSTEDVTPDVDEGDVTDPIDSQPDDKGDEGDDDSEDEGATETFNKKDAFQKLFEISFDEIRYALNALCDVFRNENEWCYVYQVYEDYFIMEDWDSNRYYKQSYTKNGDNIAFSGERTELFVMFLTESEKISVEEMRTNYASVCDKLSKYEAEPEKIQILESDEYSSIFDKEEFIELKKQKNHFDLSIDELKKSADDIILLYAKKGSLSFYSNEEEKHSVGMKQLPTGNKISKRSRYGGLGKNEN